MLYSWIFQHAVNELAHCPSSRLDSSSLHVTYLYNLCMNAVCTTLGCWVAAAAPTAGAPAPFVVASYSPLVGGPRSVTGLLKAGGPIDVVAVLEGVMSIGSFELGIGELPEDDGRIGMALRPFGAKGSVNGLRDIDSVVAAMCARCISCRFSR
jgi:hypothetical protein